MIRPRQQNDVETDRLTDTPANSPEHIDMCGTRRCSALDQRRADKADHRRKAQQKRPARRSPVSVYVAA